MNCGARALSLRHAFESLSLAGNVIVRENSHFNQGRAPVRVMGLGKAVSKKSNRTTSPKLNMRAKVKSMNRAAMLNPDSTDWPSVYEAAKTFNPSVIPIPIRMGRPSHNRTGDVPPNANGNIELLKIPNFFHLTPTAIQRHCEALEPYCTPWPEGRIDRPIRITTINHIYAGPSLRHPNSRFVKLQVYLKDLDLDDHALRKMKLLVGDRYNPKTDELTIITDKCPTRKQNKDYAYYLLTALYHESWKTEDWETEAESKSEAEINQEVEQVNAELFPHTVKEKQRNRRFYKIINGKMVRYNNVGHPFLVEMRKYGIAGALTPDEVKLAKEKWNEVQTDQDDKDTFDPIYHRSSESEFKYLI